MATPPIRFASIAPSTNWNTGTSKTSTSFNVQAGDLLVITATAEHAGSPSTVTPTASGGSVTWTLLTSQTSGGLNQSLGYCWYGQVGATATGITVTVPRPSSSNIVWGFTGSGWRSHGGIGVAFSGNSGTSSSAPGVTATCSANSAVVFQVNDWNASAVTGTTYRTINGAAETPAIAPVRVTGTMSIWAAYRTDVGASGAVTQGLTAPTGLRWILVGAEILGTGGGGPTTFDASGTVDAQSTTSGDASRVAQVLAAAGTVAALAGLSGDPARVTVRPASGTVAVSSATSGDISRVPDQVSGTVAVTSGASGDATRLTITLPASGTAAASSATTGSPTALLPTSATAPAVSVSTGDATRVPRTFDATGTTAAVSAVSGSTSVVGGPQTLPASGTSNATASSSGAVTARARPTGTFTASSATSGDATIISGPVTWQLTGTIPATAGTNGTVILVAQAVGAVDAVSSTQGDAFNPATPIPRAFATGATRTFTAVGPTYSVSATGTARALRATGPTRTLTATGVTR